MLDDEIFAVDEVDEAVFFGDPPRPRAREHVPQWFWLANAGPRIAQGVIDEPVDSTAPLVALATAADIADAKAMRRPRCATLTPGEFELGARADVSFADLTGPGQSH